MQVYVSFGNASKRNQMLLKLKQNLPQYLACFPESGPGYVVAPSKNQGCMTLVVSNTLPLFFKTFLTNSVTVLIASSVLWNNLKTRLV